MLQQTKQQSLGFQLSIKDSIHNSEQISEEPNRNYEKASDEFISLHRNCCSEKIRTITMEDHYVNEAVHELKRKKETEDDDEGSSKIMKYDVYKTNERILLGEATVIVAEDSLKDMSHESMTQPHVPWIKMDKKYSSHPTRKLHEEILDLSEYLSPTKDEHRARAHLVFQLDVLVKLCHITLSTYKRY
jgi:hypothetical protein